MPIKPGRLVGDESTLDLTDSSRSTSTLISSTARKNKQKCCMKITTHSESLSRNYADGEKTSQDEPSLNYVDEELSVRFGDVEVRSYEIILGDNPAVSNGPPLTIGWDPFDLNVCSLDCYEGARTGSIRSYVEMKIPAEVCFEMLSRTVKTSEIAKRSKEVTIERRKRLETTSTLYKSKSEEKAEKFVRGFKNVVTSKKKKERAYLTQAMVS